MSPDHVWEMCRVPSGSCRRRGDAFTSITELLFSHTYLEEISTCVCKDNTHTHTSHSVVTVNVLAPSVQKNTEGADADEKPREADGEAI